MSQSVPWPMSSQRVQMLKFSQRSRPLPTSARKLVTTKTRPRAHDTLPPHTLTTMRLAGSRGTLLQPLRKGTSMSVYLPILKGPCSNPLHKGVSVRMCVCVCEVPSRTLPRLQPLHSDAAQPHARRLHTGTEQSVIHTSTPAKCVVSSKCLAFRSPGSQSLGPKLTSETTAVLAAPHAA